MSDHITYGDKRLATFIQDSTHEHMCAEHVFQELCQNMIDQMRADLKRSGDLDTYGEAGIRIAVYEDLKDQLNHLFADVCLK